MFAALLTTFFFALSAIVARRSTVYLGPQRANLARQIVALVFLGAWANTVGQGLGGPILGWLLLSGVVGFGLGDWALFEALPRIGPALTVLLCQCLTPPIAAITEWLWFGNAMTMVQLLSSAVILVGVMLAIAPEHASEIPVGHRVTGIICGIVAAAGQAWGAVLSRYAFQRADLIGFHIDGITSAYQRLMGGALAIAVVIVVRGAMTRSTRPTVAMPEPNWRLGSPWVIANAVVGPTLGVSCYQWALQSTPSAIVLPIVATTPLLVMLIAYAFEGAKPTPRAVFGSVLAVAGVAVLVATTVTPARIVNPPVPTPSAASATVLPAGKAQ